jgi:hypothetical protein
MDPGGRIKAGRNYAFHLKKFRRNFDRILFVRR